MVLAVQGNDDGMLIVHVIPDQFAVFQDERKDAETSVFNTFNKQSFRLLAGSILHNLVLGRAIF